MESKQRIIQELVPGKQITLAHIIANIAMKSSGVELGFVDRFSGSLIITGTVSQVEAAIQAILLYTEETLGYTVCKITRT